ncbi:MAG TPA: hypothetical protein VJZ01_00440 [Lachnospiraceae bacterium]|nr:hypothetical protein [Lachnospiraceae bacterium]
MYPFYYFDSTYLLVLIGAVISIWASSILQLLRLVLLFGGGRRRD